MSIRRAWMEPDQGGRAEDRRFLAAQPRKSSVERGKQREKSRFPVQSITDAPCPIRASAAADSVARVGYGKKETAALRRVYMDANATTPLLPEVLEIGRAHV